MRKFVSDEKTNPKGKFFLNNETIMLSGANEMGNLQRCVIEENFEQLKEDILIGKPCNINYFRIAQRPVQQEVYDNLDMLGVMNQTDFPLFSTMRRPQIAEAIKQVGEMEHILRVHPSTVLVSFINEAVTMLLTEDPNSKYLKSNIY